MRARGFSIPFIHRYTFVLAAVLCIVAGALRSAEGTSLPIRTQKELEVYLSSRDLGGAGSSQNPLGYLPPQTRSGFLSSLKFGDNGLAGFSFAPLVEANLTATQAYEILELFGVSRFARSIRYLRVESPRDRDIMGLDASFTSPVRRGAEASATNDRYVEMVLRREFAEARAYAAAHPDDQLVPLPEISGQPPASAAVLRIPTDPRGPLEYERLNLDHGETLVIVATPHCGFCEQAIQVIAANPDLQEALAGAHWIVPPEDLLAYPDISEWNRRYAFAQLSVAYDAGGFSEIELDQTPVFYRLRDGKVMDRVVGWDKTKQPAALKQFLTRHSSGASG